MEVLTHALDAPIANVLIVAGIVFLGVAAVGKISGRIEPSTTGRLLLGILGLAFFSVGFVAHLRTDQGGEAPVVDNPPRIESFRANPLNVELGQTATLSWEVSGADTVSIEPGVGSVSLIGERPITVNTTTAFELTASNDTGVNKATALVQVGESQPVRVSPPTIQSFQAAPDLVEQNTESVISWAVTEADAVTIDPDIGSVALQGSRTVTPARETSYTLVASNSAGQSQAAALLRVRGPAAPDPPRPAPTAPASQVVPVPRGSRAASPQRWLAIRSPSSESMTAPGDGFRLALERTEQQNIRGVDFVRYYIGVVGGSSFPTALFQPAPDLPPCGRNANSSRTWVSIRSDDDVPVYGYCALTGPDQLEHLSFAIRADAEPPNAIYVQLHDRRRDTKYRSAELSLQ